MVPLLLLTSLALAAPPTATATIAPDGAYTLILHPPVSWSEAEVSVAGAHAVDLGPADVGEPVQLEGSLSTPGVLWVTLQATTAESEGTTWVFAVDPEFIPMASPELRRLSRRELRWRLLPRRQR